MEKADLLALAKEYAAQHDLYAVLSVEDDTPKEKIHSQWRKLSIRYHPDKLGANFDPQKWEFLERARDVLMDAAAKDVYDTTRAASVRKQKEREAMDAQRRRMVEDLEARERGVKRQRDPSLGKNTMSDDEMRRRNAAGNARMAEKARLVREALKREREEQQQRQEIPKEEPQAPQSKETPSSAPGIPTATSQEQQQQPAEDDKVADLERRLEEIRQKKAAKKARKSGVVPEASSPMASVGASRSEEQAQATPIKTPGTSSLKADQPLKDPAPAASSTTSMPSAKGDFSSLKARLKAAQAEREARKAAASS